MTTPHIHIHKVACQQMCSSQFSLWVIEGVSRRKESQSVVEGKSGKLVVLGTIGWDLTHL